MTLPVLTATAEDAAGLAACHTAAVAAPWSKRTLAGLLRTTGIDAWRIGDKRSTQAFLIVRSVLDEAEILMVATHPLARRQGHARRLLQAAIRSRGAAGVATLHLEVDTANSAAITLYRALGFVEVGRRPDYYRTDNGRRRDALLMARSCSQLADACCEGVDAAAAKPHPQR